MKVRYVGFDSVIECEVDARLVDLDNGMVTLKDGQGTILLMVPKDRLIEIVDATVKGVAE